MRDFLAGNISQKSFPFFLKKKNWNISQKSFPFFKKKN